jgi:hypothetical protein
VNRADIIEAIQADRLNITSHARKEAKEDDLILSDITYSTCHGEMIEDYPTDYPYPSCLIYGSTASGDPVHSVWAYDAASRIAVLVTVYRPDPARWINWKERRTA